MILQQAVIDQLEPSVLANAGVSVLFEPWDDWINQNNSDRSRLRIRDYRADQASGYFGHCREHSAQFRRPELAKDVLVLTHPFYFFLWHMDWYTERNEADLQKYLANLR